MATTLAESLAAGDLDAFTAVYDRLAPRLLNTARTMTGSTPDAEDVVHDLFVDLARSRSRLAHVTDLDAYVFTMLRHAVFRRRRRQGIDRVAMKQIAADRLTSARDVEPMLHGPDEDLALAIATLPSEQREVIALKIDGGLTFAEIAAVMRTSPNTAASRYRYAIEKLRCALADPAPTRERRQTEKPSVTTGPSAAIERHGP